MIPPYADCRTFEYLVAYFSTGHSKYDHIPILKTFIVTTIGEQKAKDWESFIKEQKKNGRDVIAISSLGERE